MTKPYNGGKPIFQEFMSPVGLICHLFHDAPQLKTKDQNGKIPDIDDKTGLQIAEYKITLAWEKARIQSDLGTLAALAHQVKAEGWPESVPTPQNPTPFFALEPFFRDGDNPSHNTKGKEYLFGKYYLNFKKKAEAKRTADGRVEYSGAPGLLGPYEEDIFAIDIYPGCEARCSGIMFATEYMGKHFISVRLNNIQLSDTPQTKPTLQRIGGGGTPDPRSQFGALKTNTGGNPLAGLL